MNDSEADKFNREVFYTRFDRWFDRYGLWLILGFMFLLIAIFP